VRRQKVEECRLLGYKTPFRTSQETHYISATESSRLMLCKGTMKLPSSGMLRRVDLVRTDVGQERMASIIRVTRTSDFRYC
jgi:hypothetical protein